MRVRTCGTRNSGHLVGQVALLGALIPCLLTGCGPDELSGPRIRPHLSPISFGDIYSRPSGTTADPNSNSYVPFEWTIFIQAVGTDPIIIDEVCIVGDDHNGTTGDNAFFIEGPDITEIAAQREAALRITYDHRDTNRDLTGDGELDPDQVALVIQSNAIDYPTLVVPMCGRIVPTSRERGTVGCASPVIPPAEGEADRDLCSR